MLVSSISQGLLYAILGLGIFMTFRILGFPDMSTEGTFPLGGAVCLAAITKGISPIWATLLGILAGMAAGLVTGLLYTKGKIPVVLSGILVMSGLNAVILFVMQTPNLSIRGLPRLQTYFEKLNLPDYFDTLIIGCVAVIVIVTLLIFFFNTNLGQAYIATGDNETMARSFGIKTDNMKILGLILSNGVIALSGALVCQYDNVANVNKGTGVIVIGLASLIIGEVLFSGELKMFTRLLTIAVGSIIYQLLILAVIKANIDTTYLKIFSAGILAICLMIPQAKKAIFHRFSGSKEDAL